MALTSEQRKALKEAVSAATRAALPPNARPGHPSRFGALVVAANRGREVTLPSLGYYDSMYGGKPAILKGLNG